MIDPIGIAIAAATVAAAALGIGLRWRDYARERPLFTWRGVRYGYLEGAEPFLEVEIRAVINALLAKLPDATAGIWIQFVPGLADGPFASGGVLPDGRRAKATVKTVRFLPFTKLIWVVVAHRSPTVIESGVVHEVVFHLQKMRRGLMSSDADHADPALKLLELEVLERVKIERMVKP